MIRQFLAATALVVGLASCAPITSQQTAAIPGVSELGLQGAVTSADPRATRAGEAILAQGGSATDAAIAVMLALTVVEPQSSGIGGGGFLLHWDGETVTTYDGRETAPASASPERFLSAQGKPLPREQQVISGLSVGVPGNLALAAKAHAIHGKLEWAELFEPAIVLAREGFLMNRRLHSMLEGNAGRADKTEAARKIFFGSDGKPLPVGSMVRVPTLADTLERIALEGPGALYEDSAAEFAAYVAAETPHDGKMRASDITGYQAKLRDPVCVTYRAHKVCGMGPPSSGGIAVGQMLVQLERFDLAALGPDSPVFWHLFLESQRLAYADRELYIGDSDYVPVPVDGLLDRGYLARRSALIDPAHALARAEPGMPPGAPTTLADGDEPPENGTTHFSIVDGEGNAVSYTSTIEGVFGSGLHFAGFYLNNELTDFSTTPVIDGKPVANRVEGGKRPRSSMAPTIVFDPQGKVLLVVGAAGGPTIPVQVTRTIIGVIDFGLTAEEAIRLPLLMAFGSSVITEQGGRIEGMADRLEAMGHGEIRSFSAGGKTNALLRTGNGWEAAGDPRIADMLGYE